MRAVWFAALTTAVLLTACHGSEGAGDAATNEGGGSNGGDATTPPPNVNCTAETAGCECVAGQPQPGEPAACSAISVVKTSGEIGVCCLGSTSCRCDAYMCKSSSTQCVCGSTLAIDTTFTGSVFAACSNGAGATCCRNAAAGTCTCSPNACLSTETQVARCAVQDVAVCAAGQTVAACK